MLIYKAFLNNKNYIGLFSEEIDKFNRRKIAHRGCALKKLDKYYFHNAIRKYGWDNIKWEILEDNIQNTDLLKEREKFWIKKYDAFGKNGYNMTEGGDGCFGYKHTKQSKEKMSEQRKGRKLTSEWKENIKIAIKNNHPRLGKKHSEETKNKIREKALGRKHSEKTKEAIRQKLKIRKLTDEHKKKIGLRHLGNKYWLNKKHSKETKEKMCNVWKLRKTRVK